MSNEALERIAKCEKSRLSLLDLSGLELEELPAEIGRLHWLQALDISNTLVSQLSPLGSMKHLEKLNAERTLVEDLSPLAGLVSLQEISFWMTQVEDLAPLKALSALKRLEFDYTGVSDLKALSALSQLENISMMDISCADLSPLAGLSRLEILMARRCRGLADLGPLAGLKNLFLLDISESAVSDLRPLLALDKLNSLCLSLAPVVNIAELATLPSLEDLTLRNGTSEQVGQIARLPLLEAIDLSAAQGELDPVDELDIAPLRDLPALRRLALIARGVTDLTPLRPLIDRGVPVVWRKDVHTDGINVKDCPLVIPPKSIASQGPAAVLNFFRELNAEGVDHLYEAKLMLLGEGRAGKTSLLRRLYQRGQPLPAEQETTKGIEIHRQGFVTRDGHDFRLNVWDFGGQEIYHATHQFFLTGRSLYVMVDDTAKDDRSAADEGFKYWLDLVEVFGGRSPVLIFQNEKGGRSKAIDLAGIKGRYGYVLGSYAGDLTRPDAADRLRDAIELHAVQLEHVGEELPARWVQVRASIEQEAVTRAYFSQQDYFDLYARHLPFDRTKALHLSRYLHDLGVFLHFQDDPLLQRTVILRNNWATEAVFRILDSETVKKTHGRFGAAECAKAWRDSVYVDMHPELLALMQRFEMCYLLPDTKSPTWLAPLLLPPSKPAALDGWSRAGDLVLRYHYEFLPKGLLGRLTVRLHRYVLDTSKAWRTGVLFEHVGSEVLVERLARGAQLELRARGADRKALLSVVAGEIDALNSSFYGLASRVHKLIPCICAACREAETPEFFDHLNLLKRREVGQATAECQGSFKPVNVDALLDGIGSAAPSLRELKADALAPQTPPRSLKIFLASSSELAADRDSFEMHFRRLNDELRAEGHYLEIVRWEHFLDAMTVDGLQAEYNREIRTCDVFVCLFFTKTGRFTEEEFDVAHAHFLASGTPRIYTYFKHAQVDIGALTAEVATLFAFQQKLKALNHYQSNYKSPEDLNLQFRDQLNFLRKALTLGRGNVA